MKSSFFLLAFIFCTTGISRAENGLIQSGDRIAFIGNTFAERARHYGEIQSALQLAVGPEIKDIVFRNLGWSGDSVFADSRAYFGKPDEGRERLARAVSETKPNLIFLCYGTGAAMSSTQGWTDEKANAANSKSGESLESSLKTFEAGYRAMLENIRKAAGESLRTIVLLSPPPLENLGAPLPDQSQNNQNLARFRDQIREIAQSEKCRFVDLFEKMGGDAGGSELANPALTNNGLHYTEAGYRVIAHHLIAGLGYEDSIQEITEEQRKQLKQEIIKKDTLFFNRWRPANETYLFLFRKHEQGQNAKEIPMYDPLIQKQEKVIEQVRLRLLQGAAKP